MSFTDAEMAAAAETQRILNKGVRLITPSNFNAWRDHRLDGHTFTIEQGRQMALRGIDRETVETVLVKSSVGFREMWWPDGTPTPFLIYTCPVLQKRKDGKLLVLSAGGSAKWVYADGSITKVRK